MCNRFAVKKLERYTIISTFQTTRRLGLRIHYKRWSQALIHILMCFLMGFIIVASRHLETAVCVQSIARCLYRYFLHQFAWDFFSPIHKRGWAFGVICKALFEVKESSSLKILERWWKNAQIVIASFRNVKRSELWFIVACLRLVLT